MRHRPDGCYYWIGHYMDHRSKKNVLFPLMHKCAGEVVLNLSSKVFAYFGPPKLLQSDNGREFVNSVIDNLVKDWPGEVTVINGRARHPQSQGLIEHGNAKVEEMLACRFSRTSSEHGQASWTAWLPEIQCKLFLVHTSICTAYMYCTCSVLICRPTKHCSTVYQKKPHPTSLCLGSHLEPQSFLVCLDMLWR